MTVVDWIAIGIVLLASVAGMQRGLLLSAFSLAGLAAGAYVGSRVAQHFLNHASTSLWRGVAGLVGAIVGAGLLQILGVLAASYLRGGLRITPLRALDSAGGLLLGAVTGLALVWVAAAVVKGSPRPISFRGDVERSWIVRKLDAILPPRDLPGILAIIDPFPSITGPSAPSLPPSVGVVRDPQIRASLTRVVKVLGTACGRGVEGSGWFAGRNLVVTAAHVVAGEHQTTIVEIPGVPGEHPATVVVFDPHNDIAVLRVTAPTVQPLQLADPVDGASVAITGYPLDGSLTAVPGRVGATANAFTEDAYRHRVERAITAVAGRVEHGDSGGPVIDTHGFVEGTIFAAKPGTRSDRPSGFAVPVSIVRTDLTQAGRRAVSTQACAP